MTPPKTRSELKKEFTLIEGGNDPDATDVLRPIDASETGRAYTEAIDDNKLRWTPRARKIGNILKKGAVAGAAVGSLIIGHEVLKDDTPLIDPDGIHRVYEFEEGDTLWSVVNGSYPLPDDYKTLSEHEQAVIRSELNERRGEVRVAEAELLQEAGIDLGNIPIGYDMILPADAAKGTLVDPDIRLPE